MADGTFPGLVSANRNLNAADNVIFTQLSDGTTVIGVTGGSLDVNITNASIVVTATDLDIRDLTQATDSIAIGDGTDIIAINADGSINITDNGASITVDSTDLDIRDLTASQDNVAISDGTDTLEVNNDGSINVNIVNATASNDEFHDFDLASSVAGGATANHDYTVVNATAIVTGIYIAASGDAKFEIQKDDGGGFSTITVAFTTGKQGDSKLVEFPTPFEATTTIRVIKTNRANQAQDLYSTISGKDV